MLLLLVLVVQNGTTLDATTTARADGTTTTLDLESATVTATIPSTRAAKEHVPQAPILIAAPARRLKDRCGARLRNTSKRVSAFSILTTFDNYK
jgi:hypothetical protein